MINRLANGILITMIGITLLMNTTGNLTWTVWETVIQYWPLLIIGLGAQIAFAKKRLPGVTFALILALLLSILYPYAGMYNWPVRMFFQKPHNSGIRWHSKQIEIPFDSRISEIELDMIAPSLIVQIEGRQIQNTENFDYAVFGEIDWNRHEPLLNSAIEFDKLTAVIKSPIKDGKTAGEQKWNLIFHPTVSTQINVTAGTADVKFDFGSLKAKNLSVSGGVVKCKLDCGLSEGHSSVAIAAGVADVKLSVPKAIGLRVSVSGSPLITRVKIADNLNLTKQGDSWISQNYSSVSKKIDVNISCGAGSVSISESL